MSLFLYNIFLTLYWLSARIISPFDPKAKKWVESRKHVWEELEKFKGKKTRIWFHCSSLGEYEQALPLIEKLQGNSEIVITFFSPSGYEIVKKKNPDRHIFYLPHDSKSNARRFIERIQPNVAVFVRYDLWYYYLTELKRNQIQTILISAVFRKDNIFFQWYAGLFREMLKCFNHIFVQDNNSKDLLEKHGFENVTEAGDTRIDRVAAIPQTAAEFPLVKKFKGSKKIFMVGSLEPKDEDVVLPMTVDPEILNHVKIVIAPHNVDKSNVKRLAQKIKGKVIFNSEATSDNIMSSDVLLIDSIGILSSLYRYADMVYIGGGFGEGLHNILEPAAWGKPILLGPKHQKFLEAVELVKRGGALMIHSAQELKVQVLQIPSDPQSGTSAHNYIKENEGGTELVFNWITHCPKVEK